VSGGAEAAVHATRRLAKNLPSDHVIVKLDFSNAITASEEMLYLTQLQRKCQRFIVWSMQPIHVNPFWFMRSTSLDQAKGHSEEIPRAT